MEKVAAKEQNQLEKTFFKQEAQERLHEIEIKILRFKKMADEMDPYQKLSLSMQEELMSLGVTRTDDPFALTNQLLSLMENAIERRADLREQLGLDPLAPLSLSENLKQ